jgi:hypothetical protein
VNPQVGARRERSHDRALRNRLLHGLKIFCSGMQEEVDVSINQAGKERSIAQIDHFGICRMLNRGSDFYDALTLKEYFAGLDDLSTLHI